MDILVINLQSATERMTFMAAQLQRLGLAYERLDAISASDSAAQSRAPYWERWERPLKATEKACLLSHIAAWERIIATGRPTLVLEDDAMLSRRVPEVLAALENIQNAQHVTLEVRGRRKLVAKRASALVPGLVIRRLYQDRSGAAAYVLWPDGARYLLEDTRQTPGLADAVLCRAYGMTSYQVEPACALQLDRCASHGIATPFAPVSSIDAGAAVDRKPGPRFRARRIAAQLRMGLRALGQLGRADRREIDLKPDDFQP